jgi:phosphoribosyl-AMP cyclohydrolase
LLKVPLRGTFNKNLGFSCNTQTKNMSDNWIENLKYDEKGLIPAIAQDYQDGAILMMAWMNRQALELTVSTGEVHYWSRSRQELWHKGATSGHIQKLKQLYYDCDHDVILVKIEQIGDIACHTGERSCFFTEVPLTATSSNSPSKEPRSN